MEKRIWIIICLVVLTANEGFVSAEEEDLSTYRKEGWKVFGQSAGVGGYVDNLLKDPNKMDPESLITVRSIDHKGRPVPYSRIVFVDRDEKTTRSFHEAATDKNGYAYCDIIGNTFSIMAQIFSYEPEKKAWRYQSRKIETLYNVKDKPVIIIKWPVFPEGTGKVLGHIKDQYGRPLKKFEFSLTHRDGQSQGWEESYTIHTEQVFTNPEGYFEMKDLAPLTYSYMIYPEDATAYNWDFDMGNFTIPDEPNAVVRLDIEVEANELRYGQAFYNDGMPVYPGSFQLWFKKYSPEERLKYHMLGEGHRNRIQPNGLFRIPLSQQEKRDFMKTSQGYVIIDDKESIEIGQVHIDKLSETSDGAPKLVFPRKSPRSSLVSSLLPDMKTIKIDFNPELVRGKMILVCFWDMNQRPSRNCLIQLSKRAQELSAKDILIVAVQASKIEQQKLVEWIKEQNIPFEVGMIQGDEKKTRFTWGVKSLPWLILTDKKQAVRAEGFSITELDQKIGELDNVER